MAMMTPQAKADMRAKFLERAGKLRCTVDAEGLTISGTGGTDERASGFTSVSATMGTVVAAGDQTSLQVWTEGDRLFLKPVAAPAEVAIPFLRVP
jgi:hypothetical protein